MATYTYSNWAAQATNQLRFNMVSLHLGEISEKMDNEKSADGYSRGSSALAQYYAKVYSAWERLSNMPGVSASGSTDTSPFSPARLVGRRNIY